MTTLSELKSRFVDALEGLIGDPHDLLDLIRPSKNPRHGDYQANLAMPLGKRLGRPPCEVATEIVQRLKLEGFCLDPEIVAPGFINLRIRDDWLAQRLNDAVAGERIGVAPADKPKTYVVDYSAPNVAKPMHVGHIRSTVIGDSLSRTLRFLGHRVITDNHLGDWGTQFGMIIYGYKNFLEEETYKQDPVRELARLYRLAADDKEIASAALQETAKLHAGDEENLKLWREFMPACLEEINSMYRRLGVSFDHTLGESFYHDRLESIVGDLLNRGIARESDGAICVFLEGHDVPMIVRKKDGAFLYATTDLATLRYRTETWRPDAILYVVDFRQSLHFQQLFAAARAMGYEQTELEHVSFGTVLGEDGRPYKTRSGDTVGLEGLLDEAVRRAAQIVNANDDAKPGGPELSPEDRARVAEIVGTGAIIYADLSHNRTSDYVFSYDKMLAMNGNTGTYMQYAYARVRNIFARGNVDIDALRTSASPILLKTPAERALGLELLRFSEAIDLVVADYRPNQLTSYLFELANRYSSFYEECPVLKAETEELRTSRLLLCDLTARTIRQGLELLGIKVVDKM